MSDRVLGGGTQGTRGIRGIQGLQGIPGPQGTGDASKLQGQPVGTQTPANSNVLAYVSGEWRPTTIASLLVPPTLTAVSPTMGCKYGGITIELTGTNLGAVASVTIAGQPCTNIIVLSDTLIRCDTPSLATGLGDIVVTTLAGSATLSSAYRSYYPSTVAGARVFDPERGESGNPVDTWNDQGTGALQFSGAGASRPAYLAFRFGANKRHAIVPDGIDDVLNLTGGPIAFTKMTIFAAVKFAANNSYIPNGTGEIVIGPGAAIIDFALEASAGTPAESASLRTYDADMAIDFTSQARSSLNDGTPRVVGKTHDGTTGDLKWFINNTQLGATDADTFGAGRASWNATINGGGNPLNGEIGGLVIVEDVVSAGDRSDIANWVYGKFCALSYQFTRVATSVPWIARDGAGLLDLNGTLFMLGGWNGQGGGAFPGGDKITNEVWRSTDQGATWTQILAHDHSPVGRWTGRHTAGWVVHAGYLYVIGSDIFNGPQNNDGSGFGTSDVWRSTDGITWELVTNTAPWGPRVLHMCASFQGALYVMGGMTDYLNPATALKDVWKSTDGGLNWTELSDAGWSARGLVSSGQGLPVFGNKLWVMGGGRYTTSLFNDVWSFDGVTWTQVSTGASWAARQYHVTLVFDGKLWVINGTVDVAGTNSREAWTSTDGVAWVEQTICPWRQSHADGAAVLADRIIIGPGNGNIGQPGGSGDGKVHSVTILPVAMP